MNYLPIDDVFRNPEKKNRSVGLSNGRLDKLARQYKLYVEHKVPRGLWDRELLAYEAYEVHGLACPSSPSAASVQVPGGEMPKAEVERHGERG